MGTELISCGEDEGKGAGGGGGGGVVTVGGSDLDAELAVGAILGVQAANSKRRKEREKIFFIITNILAINIVKNTQFRLV